MCSILRAKVASILAVGLLCAQALTSWTSPVEEGEAKLALAAADQINSISPRIKSEVIDLCEPEKDLSVCTANTCLEFATNFRARSIGILKHCMAPLRDAYRASNSDLSVKSIGSSNSEEFTTQRLVIARGARLILLDAASDAASGDSVQAVQKFLVAKTYAAKLALSSHTLVDSMIALGLYSRALGLELELASSNRLNASAVGVLKAQTPVDPLSTFNLGPALLDERSRLLGSLAAAKCEGLAFLCDFGVAETTSIVLGNVDAWSDAEKSRDQLNLYRENIVRATRQLANAKFSFFNIYGRMLAKAMTPNYGEYLEQRDEMLSKALLLRLQWRLQEGIPWPIIKNLALHPEFQNRFSGRLPIVDDSKMVIYFLPGRNWRPSAEGQVAKAQFPQR